MVSHRFTPSGRSYYGPGAVGTAGTFGVTFTNGGEPSTGLLIAVFGDAIEEGLVRIESVEVITDRRPPIAAQPRERTAENGRTIAVAEFPELRFGEPPEDPELSPVTAILGGPRTYVRVTARALEIGEATISVRIASVSASAEESISIRTVAAGRRPLRFADAHPFEERRDHALRELGGTDTRFALLVMNEDDDVAVPLARELLEGWVAACEEVGEGPGTLECRLWYPQTIGKFKSLNESAFPDRRGWKSALASLPHLHSFRVERDTGVCGPPASQGGPTRPPTYGFTFVRDDYGSWLDDDVVLPHVLLWERGGPRDGRAQLTELVRSVVGRCELVQAVVSRTETPYNLDSRSRPTPYEEACGVTGQGQIGQAWTTRWLRYCAEQTWIGTSLTDRLAHDELQPFVVRQHGGVLELRAEDVGALERVLAPVLPAASDCVPRTRR